jgi:NADH:ubiquinone reductase (H+-translocating)
MNGGLALRRIVIVGGGFAGVTFAQHLERRVPADWDVVVVSDENHLMFSPLLAEAAGRSISPMHMVVAGRQMLKRARWLTARVSDIELSDNLLHYQTPGGTRGSLAYDHLVLACGSVVDLDAVPGMLAYAYPLKTLGDAIVLGNNLIGCLEEAAAVPDPVERRRLLTVMVIGGGFSGVEVAGQMSDLMERTRRFYPPLASDRVRIVVVQRGERILPELNASSLSEFALSKMRQQGIEVRLRAQATEITATLVVLASGEPIEAGTVVCTVGAAPNPLIKTLGLVLERGRLKVEPDMRVTGTPNVWALGDCALAPNAYDGKRSPATAQFATRQAKQLAANLPRVLQGEPTKPFAYRPLGVLVSIGHHHAVADMLGVRLSGFLAWFLWRGTYLAKMPTLARKIELAIDWAWELLFPPNIVQLQLSQTEKVGRAHYGAGEYVFHKDDLGHRFFVIESGTAAVYLDEHQAPVAVLKAGDHFGEGALVSSQRPGLRSASVRAETPLELVTLDCNEFVRLSTSLKALNREVERSLAARRGYQELISLLRADPHLAELTVSRMMARPAETLLVNTTLAEAIERFHGGRPGYPVVDGEGALHGYRGRTELYQALRAMLPPDTAVAAFMRRAVDATSEQQTVVDAMVQLFREDVEVLPMVSAEDSARVVGVVSPIDVVRKVMRWKRERLPQPGNTQAEVQRS